MFNARSLRSARKQGFLRAHLLLGIGDVTAVTETFLSEAILDSQLVWGTEFTVFRTDRLGRSGGGVALFVRSSLQPSPVSTPSHVEIAAVDVKTKTKPIRIISAYRAPNASFDYTTTFCDTISFLCDTDHSVLLLGDFNFPVLGGLLTRNHHFLDRASEFFDSTIHQLSLKQLNKHPSREQTDNILDLIFVSADLVESCQPVELEEPFVDSDHYGLSVSVKIQTHAKQHVKAFRNFKKANHVEATSFLAQVDWDLIFGSSQDIESFSGHIYYYLNLAIENFVPLVKPRPQNSLPPYLLRLKRKLRSKFNRRSRDRQSYLSARKKYYRAIRQFHVEEEDALLRAPSQSSFYSLVKRKLSSASASLILHDSRGDTISDAPAVADAFSRHFSSVYTLDDGYVPILSSWEGNKLELRQVSEAVIEQALKKLAPKTSLGPDRVPMHFLKGVSSAILRPLSLLFSWSLTTGDSPAIWKVADVRPLYKGKGQRTSPDSYRPISKSSALAKVLEKIVSVELMTHFYRHDIISPRQFGFRPKRSTVSQLLKCVNDWTSMLSRKQSGYVVYLDFRKAFDTVSHTKLLAVLKSKGVGDSLLRWLRNYVMGRTQRIDIDDVLSPPVEVSSGVLQGSCIGPTAFLAYIESLLSILAGHTNVEFYAFCDDVKIYGSSLPALQDALNDIDVWCGGWQLQLSPAKCHVLVLGRDGIGLAPSSATAEEAARFPDPPPHLTPLTLAGHTLKFVGSARDLGVEIDSALSFSNHCRILSKSAKKSSFRTLRCFNSGKVENLLRAYTTYIRPKLEYASVVFSPVNISDSHLVERVQRYFTRAIFAKCKLRPQCYERRLKFLGLDTLAARRIKLDLVCVHKMYHGLLDGCDILQHSKSQRHHRNNRHLLKEHSVIRARLHFLTNRVVSLWNKLPESVIDGSHELFKKYIQL